LKQVVGYLFVSAFVCSLFCANYIPLFQRENIKAEGLAHLKKTVGYNQVVFKLDDFSLFKINDHELNIHGNYYEYKFLSKNKHSIRLSVRFDEKETKFEKGKEKQEKNPKKQLKKQTLQLYFVQVENTERVFTLNTQFKPMLKSIGHLSSFSDLKLNPPQLLEL
jgi:hypothetical protein